MYARKVECHYPPTNRRTNKQITNPTTKYCVYFSLSVYMRHWTMSHNFRLARHCVSVSMVNYFRCGKSINKRTQTHTRKIKELSELLAAHATQCRALAHCPDSHEIRPLTIQCDRRSSIWLSLPCPNGNCGVKAKLTLTSALVRTANGHWSDGQRTRYACSARSLDDMSFRTAIIVIELGLFE